MKKQTTRKPPTKNHEPAICPECLRVRSLEQKMHSGLEEVGERLQQALAALENHNYQALDYGLQSIRGSVNIVSSYCLTLAKERESTMNRAVLDVSIQE